MKSYGKIVKIVVLLLFILILPVSNLQASESSHPVIGPTYLGMNNVLKGTEIQRTIFIDNTDELDHIVNLSFIGDIESWVTFHEMSNTTIPITSIRVNKSSYIPIVLKVTVPEDAANRVYYGNISAIFESVEVNETGAHVKLESHAIVRLDVVGDQILNVSVERITIEDVEIKFNAKIIVEFENTGNVVAEPLVEVTFNRVGTENTGDLFLSSEEFSFNEIKPGELGTYLMWWNTSKAQLVQYGTYEAHLNISLSGIIVKEETITFKIFEAESLLRKGEIGEIRHVGDLKKGEIVYILTNFTNTGEIDIDAQFFANIYLDGNLLYGYDDTKSPIVNVPQYDKATFESSMLIKEDGEYVVECYVHYNDVLNYIKGDTETLQLKFTVGAVSSLEINPFILIPILIAAIVVILFLTRRKRLAKSVSKKTSLKSLNKKRVKPKKVVKDKKVKVKPVKESKRRIHFGRNKEKSPFKTKQDVAPKKSRKKAKKKKSKGASISKKVDEIIKNKDKSKKK